MFLQKQTFNIQDRLFRVNIVTTTTLTPRKESSLSASRGFAIEDGEVNRIAWPRPNETVADRLLLMLLFLGTFDVHRRDWRALLRRMRLLRLGNKRQKTRVLRVKWQKRIEL
jgi:hypothetical protein